jgi:hypothetical protein
VNRHLVTPLIVLASFAGTFGLMSWRAGLWRAVPIPAAVTLPARAAPSRERVEPIAPLPEQAAAAPAPRLPAAAPPEPEAVPTAVPTDEFLAARDRAAVHSSRSH